MKKSTVEYRWEAYQEDGKVMKRGPIRTDLTKTEKYKAEIEHDIVHGGLAPYWDGWELRIITRTITPWETLQPQDSEAKV